VRFRRFCCASLSVPDRDDERGEANAAQSLDLGGRALPAQSANTAAKGRNLKDLLEWLFGEVPGRDVTFRRMTDQGWTEEKDTWVEHLPATSGLALFRSLVPIDCENQQSKPPRLRLSTGATQLVRAGTVKSEAIQ
jgi:hypothetical protein